MHDQEYNLQILTALVLAQWRLDRRPARLGVGANTINKFLAVSSQRKQRLVGEFRVGRQQLSKELKEFIREQIHSVVLLEVLLLLHRDQPRSFRLGEIAGQLGVEEEVVEEQLSALTKMELITKSDDPEPLYSYHPSDLEVVPLVNELAVAYSKQRVPVLSLILARRPDRIRLFAEAFRLVKGND